MYTKNQIRELRDAVIIEKNSDQYVYAPEGATARYICETVMYESEPEKIEQKIKSFADFARINECDAIHCHDPKAVTAPTTKVVGFHEPSPVLSPYGEALVAQQTPARV